MILILSILFFGSLIIASLLSPVAYELLQHFVSEDIEFASVFGRIASLSLCVLLYIEREHFDFKGLLQEFTKPAKKAALTRLISGLCLTLCAGLAALPLMVKQTGFLDWTTRGDWELAVKFLKILPAALLIALLEESFFRVLLYNRLRRSSGILVCVLSVAAIYAVTHFLSARDEFDYDKYSLGAGFPYMQLAFERLFYRSVARATLGLFIVGCVLSFAYERYRSIYLCIGLHAGWIMALKMSLYCTFVVHDGFPEGLGRRYYFLSMTPLWISTVLVGLLLWSIAWITRKKIA